MHALSGNIPCKLIELSNGESTWEVRKYRVWLGNDGQACSCRAYLNECLGIIETKVRFTLTAKDRGLAALGSPSSTQVRPTASGASCLKLMPSRGRRGIWFRRRQRRRRKKR